MSENMDDLISNVKKMVDNGNIPSEMKQLLNNIQKNPSTSNNDLSNILNQLSPEMVNSFTQNPENNPDTWHVTGSETYGNENIKTVPKGFWYTTIFHFADGTVVMTDIKQKQ